MRGRYYWPLGSVVAVTDCESPDVPKYVMGVVRTNLLIKHSPQTSVMVGAQRLSIINAIIDTTLAHYGMFHPPRRRRRAFARKLRKVP